MFIFMHLLIKWIWHTQATFKELEALVGEARAKKIYTYFNNK